MTESYFPFGYNFKEEPRSSQVIITTSYFAMSQQLNKNKLPFPLTHSFIMPHLYVNISINVDTFRQNPFRKLRFPIEFFRRELWKKKINCLKSIYWLMAIKFLYYYTTHARIIMSFRQFIHYSSLYEHEHMLYHGSFFRNTTKTFFKKMYSKKNARHHEHHHDHDHMHWKSV